MGASRLVSTPIMENIRLQSEMSDDFLSYTDTQQWTKLAADANATVAIEASDDGILKLNTGDLTDNNEAAVRTTNKLWTFTANTTLVAESGIQFTQGDTNKANIAFGMSSAIGANWLLDNGGGPAASQSAMMVYTIDGSTYLKCCSQVGTNQTISTSTAVPSGNVTLRVEGEAQPDGSVDVCFFYKDSTSSGILKDSTTGLPIKHKILSNDVSNAAAMYVGGYVKAGGTSSNETLRMDWIRTAKTRTRSA